MAHICESYRQEKEIYIQNGGDLSSIECLEDEHGNVYFTLNGTDFIMTEDGDIIEGSSSYIAILK